MEMLRVRDEKRRMRHVETLRRQKEEGEDEGAANGGGEARVELLGDLDEERGSESSSARATSEPRPPPNTASARRSSGSSTNVPNRQVRLDAMTHTMRVYPLGTTTVQLVQTNPKQTHTQASNASLTPDCATSGATCRDLTPTEREAR